MIGKKILITAGPTREDIDPVRFIGNRSSGKMGYALAASCAARGAEVILISGPVNLLMDDPSVHLIKVITAEEMYQQCMEYFPGCHAAIMSAAVSDFTPKVKGMNKIKRGNKKISLELVPTKDIAASLGEMKTARQVLVGFALESDNEIVNARKKLIEKNLDFIVVNSLRVEGAGFESDTNKITIIDRDNNIEEFELKHKKEVAEDIVDKLETYMNG